MPDSEGLRSEPSATDATQPDVARLRDRFGNAPQRGSLERDRAAEAVHRALFGFSKSPVKVGRFVLGDRLGAGAMGIVYAAHDPQLDRKVAVKVLHPQTDPSIRDENVARLLREAKTLARLTHPNVVTVHEVGETDGGLFIAMQFVAGDNLGAWMAARPRPWPEILHLFLGAGAGLAAAHRQDLVHRDFKPDNVLVDLDGHPRVADFGLACSIVDAPTTEDGRTSVSMDRVTQTGAVVGTPAYMAPELFDGGAADALSDQYSFCVALYEALYGVRPFAGTTISAFIEHALSMELTPPLAGRVAPSWLRRVVLRGLSPDPGGRFASMDELLRRLERGRHRRRRFAVAGLAGLAGVSAIGAVFAYGAGARRAADARCPDAEALRDEVWDGTRRAQIASAFANDTRPHVQAHAANALQTLDAWASGWGEARADACQATRERAEQSAALLDQRVQCYELAATAMHGLVDSMAGQPDALAKAPAVTASLPDLRLCADPQWVAARRPLPKGAEARDRIEALSRSIARAKVLQYGGALAEAQRLADEALLEAEALEYPPIAADALRVLARVHSASGRPNEAEAALARALTESLGAGNEWEAAVAATSLIEFVGRNGKRKAERERWTKVAQGIITKLGSPADLTGDLALGEAIALRAEGDPTAALASAEVALERYIEHYGEADTRTAHAHEEIGLALDILGRADESVIHVERSVEIERKVWGEQHPRVGSSLVNLGIVYAQQGRIDDGAKSFAQAVAILEAVYGSDSIMIVQALTNSANAAEIQGKYEEALALNLRARAIRTRVHGPDHIEVAVNLANGGSALTQLERYDEAMPWLQQALKIRTEKLGVEHPVVAHAHYLLGAANSGQGNLGDAATHYERAAAIWSATLGPEHPSTGSARVQLGDVRVRAGEREAGLQQMRRGVSILRATRGDDHPDVASAQAQLRAAETLDE
ncbi:MAG: serine/threonine-protein kinase [Myxococcota bacterium]